MRGGVIAILIFDLMTLNMCHVLRLAWDNYLPNASAALDRL